jgi:hypothetical protein
VLFYPVWPTAFSRPRAERSFNVVILAESFRADREDFFLAVADFFASQLLRTPPFHQYRELITISAIFEASIDSLALWADANRCDWRGTLTPFDDPAKVQRLNTPFNALFCRRGDDQHRIERSLWGSDTKVGNAITSTPELAGLQCNALVIVNSQADGGSGRGYGTPPPGATVGWFSLSTDWVQTAIHELGHSAFMLADEYEYDGPVIYAGVEPLPAENVTAQTSRIDLRAASHIKPGMRDWEALIDPATALPTQLNAGCQGRQTRQPEEVMLPPGTVGLFEGADHSKCKVYRPTPMCKMRDHDFGFCPVCERTIYRTFAEIRTQLVVPTATVVAGVWTHVATYYEAATRLPSGSELAHYLFYNAADVTGPYAIHEADPAKPGEPGTLRSAAGATLGVFGWSTLLSVDIDGLPHIVAHSLPFARLAIYRVDYAAGTASLTSTFDSGQNNYPFTHVAVFSSRGKPHLIGYNMPNGTLDIGLLDRNNRRPPLVYGTAQDPLRIWRRDYTHIATFTLDGVPHVLKHDALSGEVHLQSLDPPGPGPATYFSATNHWNPGATHVIAYESEGRSYVHRTVPGSYVARDWVWPRGSGVEPMARENTTDLTLSLTSIESRTDSGPSARFNWIVALLPNRFASLGFSSLRLFHPR